MLAVFSRYSGFRQRQRHVHISPAVSPFTSFSIITFIAGTVVSIRPLAFHLLVDLMAVKTPLGPDLGCGELSVLRHPVQFAAAELQVPGQFIQGEPSVGTHHHLSTKGTLRRHSVCQRILTNTNEYQRMLVDNGHAIKCKAGYSSGWQQEPER